MFLCVAVGVAASSFTLRWVSCFLIVLLCCVLVRSFVLCDFCFFGSWESDRVLLFLCVPYSTDEENTCEGYTALCSDLLFS